MSELNLILLGPPGSGKGTQGERLQEDFRLPYYATGDILRAAVKEGTELGRTAKEYMDEGGLVPDEVIIGVIGERVEGPEAADGFILDGFPRTIGQAEALGAEMDKLGRSITAVVLIDTDDEEVQRRLGGRRTCAKNGHIFHVEFDPPKNEGVCDVCGARLIVRDDDKPEVIAKRLDTYHSQTEPLVDYYEERGLLKRVDGARRPTRSATGSGRCWRRCGSRRSSSLRARSRTTCTAERSPRRRPSRSRRWPPPAGSSRAATGCSARAPGPASRTAPPRRDRREVHPLAGRDPGLQGLPRLPGLDLRLAELDGGARDPRRLRAQARRRAQRSTSA